MNPRPLCAKESIFWGKNGCFRFKHANYFGRGQKFWYPHICNPPIDAPRLHCFSVGHGTTWPRRANIRPKINKNAYIGQNLAVFGPKILIFTGRNKSFGTHITEKPPRHLVCIVFWSGTGRNGPMPIFGPKWPKMPNLGVFGPKILILSRGSKSFGTQVTEKPPRHLVRIVFCLAMGPNGPKMSIFGQKSQFWANFGRLWAKIPNFNGSN